MKMKLDDVLNAGAEVSQAQNHAVFYFHGAIESDHNPAYFRLYSNPHHRRSYMLVKKTDVAGDLYEWTSEETSQAGFIGTKVYRVPLQFGTEVQVVSVAIVRVGPTSAAKTAAKSAFVRPASNCPSGLVCGCANPGCTEGCSCTFPSEIDNVTTFNCNVLRSCESA
jgi:hypothetical protein